MFAFVNKKTGKYLTGSDFNYSPPRAFMSDILPPLLMADMQAVELQRVKRRLSNRTWQAVEVSICKTVQSCDHLLGVDSAGQEMRVSHYEQYHWEVDKYSFSFCPDCGADITYLRGKKF